MGDLAQITKDLDASAEDLEGYMGERGIQRDSEIYAAWLKLELTIMEIRRVVDHDVGTKSST